jgi:hypothetical protein
LAESCAWLSRSARRIDQLPGDNVDADLLLWGAQVSSNLRETAGILTAGQQRIRARGSQAQATAAYAAQRDYVDRQAAAQAAADRENFRRQANQYAAEERASVLQDALKPLEAALKSRGEIRATMAGRYGAGF